MITAKQEDILFYSCLAAIMALAIFFRSQGYFDGNISFWWDEADWANKLLTKPLIEVIKIRPIGYMALTRLLVNTFGTAETVFRLLSYLASILVIPLIFLIARRLWNSKIIILLIVFLTAFNPNLITFAKEFKPYAFEFFVHTSLIFLALLYIDSRKVHLFYALLAFSVLSIFFCYNIVFIFPALFIILLLDAYSNRNKKRFVLLVAAGLLICITLYLMYKAIWSGINLGREEKYWADKYDVFFLGPNLLEHFKWYILKYAGLVQDSGRAEIFWPALSSFSPLVGLVLIFFHVAGVLGFLLERKLNYLILFLLPILTVILVNFLGMWPFGTFRVNLFLTIYFLILTANGFYYFLNKKNKILHYGVLGIVAVFFLLQLPVNFHYYTIKPRNTWLDGQSDVRKALETIVEYENRLLASGFISYGKITVAVDNHANFVMQYYLTQHPESSSYGEQLQKLNIKYKYVLSGVETFQPEGAQTIIGTLQSLQRSAGVFRGDQWFLIGNPKAIDRIEPIVNSMPERIVYKKKFSYGTLVMLLRV